MHFDPFSISMLVGGSIFLIKIYRETFVDLIELDMVDFDVILDGLAPFVL